MRALYPFGYGLSYTSFAFENVAADADKVTEESVSLTGQAKVYVGGQAPDDRSSQLTGRPPLWHRRLARQRDGRSDEPQD